MKKFALFYPFGRQIADNPKVLHRIVDITMGFRQLFHSYPHAKSEALSVFLELIPCYPLLYGSCC